MRILLCVMACRRTHVVTFARPRTGTCRQSRQWNLLQDRREAQIIRTGGGDIQSNDQLIPGFSCELGIRGRTETPVLQHHHRGLGVRGRDPRPLRLLLVAQRPFLRLGQEPLQRRAVAGWRGAFAEFDRLTQWAEVQAGDKRIDQTDRVIGGQQGIQRPRGQDHLITHRLT